MTDRIREFLRDRRPEGPCLVVDLDVVRENYRRFRPRAARQPRLLRGEGEPGAGGAQAPRRARLVLRLRLGRRDRDGARRRRHARPHLLRQHDQEGARHRRAFARGIRLFAVDCVEEVEKIARAAPGARVFCRILCDGAGAEWPLSRKFGCAPEMAIDVLEHAHRAGLEAYGVSFHVGSQQPNPKAWDGALKAAGGVFRTLSERGIQLRMVNLGGGFPARY